MLIKTPLVLLIYLDVTLLILVFALTKKRSVKSWLFSLYSWNITAIGLLKGLFLETNPKKTPKYKIVKNG
jgi:hypothetical protein